MIRTLIFAAVVAWATPSFAGTVFVAQGGVGKESYNRIQSLTGTVTIDTITGTLESLDLYFERVDYAPYVPFDVFHAVRGPEGQSLRNGFVRLGAGWSDSNTSLGAGIVLDATTLVGYTGGGIKPTENIMEIFWSGMTITSTLDASETQYRPIHWGSLTPLVVPEPTTWYLALAFIAIVVVTRLIRKARRNESKTL